MINAETRERLWNAAGVPVRYGGQLYLLSHGRIFSCEDCPEGMELLRAMAGDSRGVGEESSSMSVQEAWRRCITTGDATASDKLDRCGVTEEIPRCVILFRKRQEDGTPVGLHELTEVALKTEDEVLIETGPGEIAMVRNAYDQTVEDTIEYARAVIEFAESEAGLPLRAGIGSTQVSLGALHRSYREAVRSIEIGQTFHLNENVHVYQKQILERLLACVPEDERKKVRDQVLDSKTRKMLNDEMRETIRVFFENDLNLSTTARQMFVHRNTLTYRLDRVKKATGLDLRTFQDAIAFKVIMELPGDEHPEK